MAQATKQETPTTWQARLVEELTRDTKKTVILAVLVLVGVIFGVRTLSKSTPASAGAAPTGTPEELAMLMGGQGNPTDARLKSYDTPQEPRVDIPKAEVVITRDMFAFDPSGFEVIETVVEPQDEETPIVVTDPDQVDAMKAVQAAAAELTLQSTMASDTPVALINGQVLSIGERIDGFTVTSISAESCVVAKQGVNVVLLMGGDAPQD